jgi:ankyrin repeat protein
MAADRGHLQTCELLLNRGADVNYRNNVSDVYYNLINNIFIVIIIVYNRLNLHL